MKPDESPSLVDLARAEPFRVGSVDARPATREVVAGERREVLEPRVMQVLVALARRRGEVVSRDELISACWGGQVVGEDALNRAIARVRRIAEAFGGFSVETVARVGYRLSDRDPDSQPPARGARPSIVVLPFSNMSDEAEQDYFSDGITEDIITDLSKVSALFVVARNNAFTFKGKSVDVRQVARDLEVSHVLEGSVRKAGGRVRITAQLIDGASGGHVWAERYDRDLTDIFALQDEISRQVVEALKLRLLPEERVALVGRGTASAAAYDFVLMARKHYTTGVQGDPDWGEAIARLARRAVELDPNYAEAWAYLALGQVATRYMVDGAADDGTTAAERALALNPELAEAHAVRGRIFMDAHRYAEATAELTEALRLNPDSNLVNYTAGMVSFFRGRPEEAIAYFGAAALDETDFNAAAFLTACHVSKRDEVGMRRAAALTVERAGRVLAQDRNNAYAMATCARAFVQLGDERRAREMMERALLVGPGNAMVRYLAASVLAALGDTDAAADLLAPSVPTMTASVQDLLRGTRELDEVLRRPDVQALLDRADRRPRTGR